jgi:hypothetical protein
MGKKKHLKPANKNTAKEPAQEGTKAAVAENTLETGEGSQALGTLSYMSDWMSSNLNENELGLHNEISNFDVDFLKEFLFETVPTVDKFADKYLQKCPLQKVIARNSV